MLKLRSIASNSKKKLREKPFNKKRSTFKSFKKCITPYFRSLAFSQSYTNCLSAPTKTIKLRYLFLYLTTPRSKRTATILSYSNITQISPEIYIHNLAKAYFVSLTPGQNQTIGKKYFKIPFYNTINLIYPFLTGHELIELKETLLNIDTFLSLFLKLVPNEFPTVLNWKPINFNTTICSYFKPILMIIFRLLGGTVSHDKWEKIEIDLNRNTHEFIYIHINLLNKLYLYTPLTYGFDMIRPEIKLSLTLIQNLFQQLKHYCWRYQNLNIPYIIPSEDISTEIATLCCQELSYIMIRALKLDSIEFCSDEKSLSNRLNQKDFESVKTYFSYSKSYHHQFSKKILAQIEKLKSQDLQRKSYKTNNGVDKCIYSGNMFQTLQDYINPKIQLQDDILFHLFDNVVEAFIPRRIK